jgi:alkaline phosphatase
VSSQLTALKVETILKWAQDANKDTGFVTTSRVSHATPAAMYAHVADRDYECDKKLPQNSPKGVHDITYQLVANDPGRKAKVVMGGGSISWMSKKEHERNWKQPAYHDHDHTKEVFDCDRLDGKNLVKEFLKKHQSVPGFENKRGKLVRNRDELLKLDVDETDYLLGLFSASHMQYEDIRRENESLPSLPEMTRVAIEVLKKNQEENNDGFFLMVENDFIDHAHHNTRASASLLETMIFDEAVEMALSLVSTDDTLIIITSDHSHTMTMGGFQTRGSDIRGLVDTDHGKDNLPYSILSYANGPAFSTHLLVDDTNNVTRLNLTGNEDHVKSFAFQNPSSVPMDSETHGGDDVGIFAIGPYSHLFHSVHEQSYIAHVMAYSACLGPYRSDEHCNGYHSNAMDLFRIQNNKNYLLILMAVLIVVTNI